MHTSWILIKYLNGDVLDNIYFLKKIKMTIYILDRFGPTMVNVQNPRYEVWDDNKNMKYILKQLKKLNYNEPNIEGWK
jgi:hypothetical protein